MESFLSKIVDKIESCVGGLDFSDTLVVLPNRRAHRRLLAEFAKRHPESTFFAPAIYPMEEFVAHLSPLKQIESSMQILRLHEATRNIPNERCKLENLQSWGVPFLRDISEMDMQMEDVPVAFREYAIAASFEIPFGKDEPSETDTEKIRFNELLAGIYSDFRNLLAEKSEGYTGMLYRDCAENIAEYAKKIQFKHIFFAGFYALAPAELLIIKHIKENFDTEIIFDVDPFYCKISDNNPHEVHRQTSFFLKRDCNSLGLDINNIDFVENNYENDEKDIEIVATSKNWRQIYAAIEAVGAIRTKKIHNEDVDVDGVVNMSDTAVVLADESLLMPFLSSYNVENVELNVTMGIPFSQTTFYALLKTFIQMYENAIIISRDAGNLLKFVGADVQNLFENPFLKGIFTEDNIYYPNVFEASEMPGRELFLTFERQKIGRFLPAALVHFCLKIRQTNLDSNDLILATETVKRLEDLRANFDKVFADNQVVDFSLAKLLTLNALETLQISQTGDADKGLQVMGLLETRVLDFKNVVVVSVNEGVIPKDLRYDSLLPFDFKYKFSGGDAISNYLYQDQVYAYHFFRLLQRAENVVLIYNSESGNSISEISRFIPQMTFEAEKNGQANLKFSYSFKDFALNLSEKQNIEIPKTDDLINKLRNYQFSASALKNYVRCPVMFFLKNIAKIEKRQVYGDELSSIEMGNVLHDIFEDVFNEILNETGRSKYPAILDRHIDNVSSETVAAIRKLRGRENLTEAQLGQGAWVINRYLIEENVKNYLNAAKIELQNANLSILGNEMMDDIKFEIPDPNENGSKITVPMKGFFDRVQQNGGYIEILDYKSGNVDAKYLDISKPKPSNSDKAKKNSHEPDCTEENGKKLPEDPSAFLEPLFSNPDYEKLFQLVLYMILYKNSPNTKELPVRAGIISTHAVNRNSEEYIFWAMVNGNAVLSDNRGILEERLAKLFTEIFDKKVPFVCKYDTKKCRNCDYRNICISEFRRRL